MASAGDTASAEDRHDRGPDRGPPRDRTARLRPGRPGRPAGGPATRPGRAAPTARPAPPPTAHRLAATGTLLPPDRSTAPATGTAHRRGGIRATGGLWIGLILSAVVLLFLLVFILQNGDPVRITFLGPRGHAAHRRRAAARGDRGLLLVAIPGGLRILQLRRAAGGRAARGG